MHNARTRLSSLDSINNLFDDWIDIFGRNGFEGITFAPIYTVSQMIELASTSSIHQTERSERIREIIRIYDHSCKNYKQYTNINTTENRQEIQQTRTYCFWILLAKQFRNRSRQVPPVVIQYDVSRVSSNSYRWHHYPLHSSIIN